MQRIRVTYARTAPLRYTGHLDMQIVWERCLRRARLPLMYSQGFHPQPRINQACPLPLGMTSQMEVMDFWLEISVAIMFPDFATLAFACLVFVLSLYEEEVRESAEKPDMLLP